MPEELTELQVAFAREYAANGGKGAEAARKAGYSEKSAGKIAYQLLEKTHVLAAIQREQRRAFTELASIALGQVRAMLLDAKTPVNARVELARMAFDRAGLAAIRPDEESSQINERSLREMSLQELEAIAVSLKFKRQPAAQLEPVTVGEASLAEDAERAPPAIDSE